MYKRHDVGIEKSWFCEGRETDSMQVIQKFFAHCCEEALKTRVACLSIDLGYTAAITAVKGEWEWDHHQSG